MTLLELTDATMIRIMHCNVAVTALFNSCTLPKAAHPVYDRGAVSTQKLVGSDECFPN